MKSIKKLVSFLKFFGWLGIISGIIFLMVAIFMPHVFLFPELTGIQGLISGLVYLLLARSLLKKEKWAWYIALFVFALAFFSNIIQLFWRRPLISFLLSLLLPAFFIYLLLKGRQVFIEQPKEKILQWFHNPYFVITIAGIIVQHIFLFFMFSYIFEYMQ